VNWLDIVILTVLALSVFRSFRRGFSREIIGLAAAGAALVLGMWFYGLAGSYVSSWVSSTQVANLLGFFLVVFAVIMFGALAGMVLQRFLRTVGLSFFDRLLGAVFGLARGSLVVVALLTAFIAFGPRTDTGSQPSAVLNSRIAPSLLEASRFAVAIAPMELKQSFRSQYTRIRSELNRSEPKKKSLPEHERNF
jgi:membrane protein required for colicin V production